jgi:uncharacterized Zn-finger protein
VAKKERACVLRRYDVTLADLPLSCPMPNMRLWDAHPRVYLPIEATGHVVCPYCDAEYFLKSNNE